MKLPNGGIVWLDSAYPDKLLFLETCGWGPHRNRRAFVRDRRRENQVVLLGWKPLGFTWDDVTLRPEEMVAEVEAARAAARGPEVRPRIGAGARRGGRA